MLKKKNNSNKNELRAELKKARNNLEPIYVEEASKLICQRIIASSLYKNANVILAYLAFGKEVSCDELVTQALADGKTVCIPYIIDKEHFLAAKLNSLENLVLDRYGIRTVAEPIIEVSHSDIGLILVPGLAFGRDGSRMGMGAGYYDRFLADTQAITLGLAYEKMLQDEIPTDEHDIAMEYIITESNLIQCS